MAKKNVDPTTSPYHNDQPAVAINDNPPAQSIPEALNNAKSQVDSAKAK
jgi:hypothetical protein